MRNFPDFIIKDLNKNENNMENVLDEATKIINNNNTDPESKSGSHTRPYDVSIPQEEKYKIGQFLTCKTVWITTVILIMFCILLCFFFWIRVNRIIVKPRM